MRVSSHLYPPLRNPGTRSIELFSCPQKWTTWDCEKIYFCPRRDSNPDLASNFPDPQISVDRALNDNGDGNYSSNCDCETIWSGYLPSQNFAGSFILNQVLIPIQLSIGSCISLHSLLKSLSTNSKLQLGWNLGSFATPCGPRIRRSCAEACNRFWQRERNSWMEYVI